LGLTGRKKSQTEENFLMQILTLPSPSQIKFSDQNENEGMITACGRQGGKR
jgi:hypothetical protein